MKQARSICSRRSAQGPSPQPAPQSWSMAVRSGRARWRQSRRGTGGGQRGLGPGSWRPERWGGWSWHQIDTQLGSSEEVGITGARHSRGRDRAVWVYEYHGFMPSMSWSPSPSGAPTPVRATRTAPVDLRRYVIAHGPPHALVADRLLAASSALGTFGGRFRRAGYRWRPYRRGITTSIWPGSHTAASRSSTPGFHRFLCRPNSYFRAEVRPLPSFPLGHLRAC